MELISSTFSPQRDDGYGGTHLILASFLPLSNIFAIPSRGDLVTYEMAMSLLILVGVMGVLLHIQRNLVAENAVVVECFVRGAPFLAPMLISDMGALGLIILLDPKEKSRAEPETQTSA